MNFGNAGIQFTIKVDEKQLEMITKFIFQHLKDAKDDLDSRIDKIEDEFQEEIRLIKGKLP